MFLVKHILFLKFKIYLDILWFDLSPGNINDGVPIRKVGNKSIT